MGELERTARFFEGSWVGQFLATDEARARIFAQAVADKMKEMGVQDAGYAVREGSRAEFSDEAAEVSLVEDVVPQAVVHDSVSHTELRRQLKEASGGDGDEGRET